MLKNIVVFTKKQFIVIILLHLIVLGDKRTTNQSKEIGAGGKTLLKLADSLINVNFCFFCRRTQARSEIETGIFKTPTEKRGVTKV